MRVWKPLVSLLLLLLLAGCGDLQEPVPSVVEPMAPFSYTFEERAFLAPDGSLREHAFRNVYENEALRLHWIYPEPQLEAYTTPAAKAMCAWFREQGLLCGLEALVQTALADWADARETGREFHLYYITQETFLTCRTGGLWAFSTRVSAPENYPADYMMEEPVCRSDFFDAATGEHLELWALFTAPEETVRQRLLDLCQEAAPPEDAISRAELEQWFQPASVLLFPEHVEVVYAPGTLERKQRTYAFEYDGLAELLQPWALPEA